jgi:hypothetical protein
MLLALKGGRSNHKPSAVPETGKGKAADSVLKNL